MLRLEQVNGRNVWDILKLTVKEDQKSFVADNAISIIEAYMMIDKACQGRGFGKEAVQLALDYIKTFPCGKAEYCWLSYEPENEAARQLYRSFGFSETGEADGEELIAVLRLQG